MRNPYSTELLFELSKPGCGGAVLPRCDVPAVPVNELLPAEALADKPLPLPELSEPDVVRHFVNLSTLNMSVDTHFYPLGSCTMKYNPKRNERIAAHAGLRRSASVPAATTRSRACWNCSTSRKQILAEIAGLPAVSLQPAAGAHGELTALLVAAAYFRDKQSPKSVGADPRRRPRHQSRPAPPWPASIPCR